MRERTRIEDPKSVKIGILMCDVKDVADACSLGVSTVWRLVKDDPTFPKPIYFGAKVARFKVDDIKKWVDQLGKKHSDEPLAA